ncbi:hypothetical protein [Peribacillus loiseleuriae]|uniref:Uncharacterized protein n=1 Tax=Peribacillus loiseleuriae TaxID=1679170 RepID=A0A0K9GV89_9BACI|nr:hypothetical protein [Peribacillus loiseleuriae]KMY50541.1 hypothetical protein AC625_14360 [Peribacillus loiseleuriae]
MFQVHEDDLQYLFESAGQPVLINDTPMNVIVTNPSISEYEERYIHSLNKVSRGDLVTLEGEQYLCCLSESVTKRHGKYKAVVRHCNYNIEVREKPTRTVIGYTAFRDPIFDEIPGELHLIPSFIETQSFSVTNGIWVTSNNEILVTVKDITEYKPLLELSAKVEVMGKTWQITNLLLDKKGLITLNCKRQ